MGTTLDSFYKISQDRNNRYTDIGKYISTNEPQEQEEQIALKQPCTVFHHTAPALYKIVGGITMKGKVLCLEEGEKTPTRGKSQKAEMEECDKTINQFKKNTHIKKNLLCCQEVA